MKKLIRFIIIAAAITALTVTFVFAKETVLESDGFTWTFEDTTGTLTISGKGALTNRNDIPNGITKHIVVSEGITSLPAQAFAGRTMLEDISLPSSLLVISEYSFFNCKSLTTVNFPASLLRIGSGAFMNCTSLSSVSLQTGLLSLGNSVFSGCTSLKSITMPDSIVEVGHGVLDNTAYYNDANNWNNNENWDNEGLYVGHYLIEAKSGNTDNYTVNSVTRLIADNAFSKAKSFKSIVLPSSLRYIGNYAFNDCDKIRYLTFPDGVITIGDCAFSDCLTLEMVKLPKSIKNIGERVADNCQAFKGVEYAGSIADKYALNISQDNKVFYQSIWYYGKDVSINEAYAGYANFTPSIDFKTSQFTDVERNAWYFDNVRLAFQYGLVKGNTPSTFNPSGNITIAETLALACRLHNTYTGNKTAFLQGSPWYKVYVDYAVKNGIIESNRFSSYTVPATRAVFAEIMAKAFSRDALKNKNYIAPLSIPDVIGNESYADYVYTLYQAGILTGSDEKGTFKPQSNISRAEVATIVTRMANESMRKSISISRPVEEEKPKF